MLFYSQLCLSDSLIEINTIKQLEKYTTNFTEKDLVVFDIDKVILAPQDLILRDTARATRRKFFEGIKKKDPNKLKLLLSVVNMQANGELVEPEILKIIYNLQRKKVKVIAITLMGPNSVLEDQESNRYKLLKGMGIELSNLFKSDTIKIDNSKREQPRHIGGVIFSRGYDKGLVLENFLQQIKFSPRKIAFIDDHREHVINVDQHMQKRNINFYGLWYRPSLLPNDPPINQCIVANQFKWLEKKLIWLSDKQASILCP